MRVFATVFRSVVPRLRARTLADLALGMAHRGFQRSSLMIDGLSLLDQAQWNIDVGLSD